MKRTSKRYVVTTSALNCYLFRVLTSGGDIGPYANNALVLWMHQRATGNSKDQILPLGNGVDLKFEGDELTCYLEFDENDPFAMQVYNKYENGTLNMLSLGAKPLELSDDPSLKLPGQQGPTVTKWLLLEISCVDIGANPEALGCQLYDADDNKIEMASLTEDSLIKLFGSLSPQTSKPENTDNMKLIQLSGASLTGILLALKLEETATEVDVQKKVADLVQLNAAQGTTITTLTASESDLKKQLNDAAELALSGKIEGVITAAGKKILPAQVENYRTLLKLNFDGTKAIIESLPSVDSVAETINKKKTTSDKAVELTYDELDRKGMLIALKAENPELFKSKFFDKFKKEYGS